MRTGTAPIVLAAVLIGALTGCGGSSTPGQPSTPTPGPTPTPVPTPTPGIVLPPGMTCNPTPPPLYGMKVGIFDDSSARVILDSKPLVVNENGYCDRVGIGSGRFCETRPEGHAERVACDYLMTGTSPATGRWGPTWTWDGKPCDGDNFTSCANHQENQFMAIAKVKGRYEACASSAVPIAPDGQRCGGVTID